MGNLSLSEHFALQGDDLIRIKTGRIIPPTQEKVWWGKFQERYYRVKFFLMHGFMPTIVDHKNRDRTANSLDNLRAGTQRENMWNSLTQGRPRGSLPRGVRKSPNGRYYAQVMNDGVRVHLGMFNTPEEASDAYQTYCQSTRGEWHPTGN